MDEKDLIAAVAPPTDSKPAEEDPLAEQKAAFDALLKQQEDGNDGGKSATKAAKDAVAEAKAKKAPKAEKAAKPAEGEAEAPQKAKEDPKQKSETERLRAKLLLSGAPKAAIESLTDDDVREWWSNQEQREADRARALEPSIRSREEARRISDEGHQPIGARPRRGAHRRAGPG